MIPDTCGRTSELSNALVRPASSVVIATLVGVSVTKPT
jgi:hypothetical protein